jgi:hypothetical protein
MNRGTFQIIKINHQCICLVCIPLMILGDFFIDSMQIKVYLQKHYFLNSSYPNQSVQTISYNATNATTQMDLPLSLFSSS